MFTTTLLFQFINYTHHSSPYKEQQQKTDKKILEVIEMQYAMQLPNDDDGKTQNRITELQYNNTTNNDQFKFSLPFL